MEAFHPFFRHLDHCLGLAVPDLDLADRPEVDLVVLAVASAEFDFLNFFPLFDKVLPYAELQTYQRIHPLNLHGDDSLLSYVFYITLHLILLSLYSVANFQTYHIFL